MGRSGLYARGLGEVSPPSDEDDLVPMESDHKCTKY